MSKIDRHKLVLRLKVLEMIRSHAQRRLLSEAYQSWRRLIQPN